MTTPNSDPGASAATRYCVCHTPPLSLDECPHEVKKQRDRLRVAEAQSDWFVSEVHRHRALGIPVGCCDEWPECSHMLAYYEEHREEILGR